jgi:hypothetical protein
MGLSADPPWDPASNIAMVFPATRPPGRQSAIPPWWATLACWFRTTSLVYLFGISPTLKSFKAVFFYPRTWVTLCRVHNMVLDDVHSVAHLSTTIIVLSSNSICYLSFLSFKSFLSDLFHSELSEFRLRKHFDLMLFNISIYLNRYQCFPLSINTIS